MEGIILSDALYRADTFYQIAGVSQTTYKRWRRLGLRVRRTPSPNGSDNPRTVTFIYGKDFIEFITGFDDK